MVSLSLGLCESVNPECPWLAAGLTRNVGLPSIRDSWLPGYYPAHTPSVTDQEMGAQRAGWGDLSKVTGQIGGRSGWTSPLSQLHFLLSARAPSVAGLVHWDHTRSFCRPACPPVGAQLLSLARFKPSLIHQAAGFTNTQNSIDRHLLNSFSSPAPS